jgi:hypothetical protein
MSKLPKDHPDRCVICGQSISATACSWWYKGHNAQPVADGQCCDVCNELEVIPERMRQMREYLK